MSQTGACRPSNSDCAQPRESGGQVGDAGAGDQDGHALEYAERPQRRDQRIDASVGHEQAVQEAAGVREQQPGGPPRPRPASRGRPSASPETTPTIDIIEPTDRSNTPPIISIIIPSARMPSTARLFRTARRFAAREEGRRVEDREPRWPRGRSPGRAAPRGNRPSPCRSSVPAGPEVGGAWRLHSRPPASPIAASSMTVVLRRLIAAQLADQAALAHDQDAVGDGEDLRQVRRDDDDGRAPARQVEEQLWISALAPTSTPRVGSSTMRTTGARAATCQGHLLLVAAAELPDGLVRTSAGDPERAAERDCVGVPRRRSCHHAAPMPAIDGEDVVRDAHLEEEAGLLAVLGQVSDAGRDRLGRGPRRRLAGP